MPSVVWALSALRLTEVLISCSEAVVCSTLAACCDAESDSVCEVCITCCAALVSWWAASRTWPIVPPKVSSRRFRLSPTLR
jgi:hypothetical protein